MTDTELAGRAALALDQILCGPDAHEILGALRTCVPTDLLDQGDAAAADVAAGMRQAAASGVADLFPELDPLDHPGWVRLGVLTAFTTLATGQASTCMHSPVASRPQPVFAAAWRPGLIACGRCTHLFAITNAAKDATCDGCGRVTTGPANNDGIWPCEVVFGLLTWKFGVCDDCRYATAEVTR